MPQTLHCPQCTKAVSVGDDSSGKRVKCPHCEKVFLAPGFAPASNDDDDDWLQLDNDPPKTAAPVAGTNSPPTVDVSDEDPFTDLSLPGQTPASGSVQNSALPGESRPHAETPDSNGSDQELPDPDSAFDDFGLSDLPPVPDSSSDDEAAILAKFGSALKDFTANVEPLPGTSAGGSRPGPSDPRSESPASTSADARATPKASPPSADAVEYASEYRVKCKICGSNLYAKASQQGKKITCSDCHSQVTVPPPPKIKTKIKIDVENAKTFGFEEAPQQARRGDPYRKSANELLQQAELEEEQKDKDPTVVYDDDTPSIRQWAMDVFGVFLDPSVIVHWLGLSTFAAIPAFIALSFESPILLVGLVIGGLVLAALVVSCGFAIMQSVANQHESVSDWPEANPTAWMDDLVVAVSAAALAGVPIWALTTFAFGPHLLAAAGTMFAIYALFPFFILSMMDMQSIFVPFSPEVAKSVSRCQESWGGLYLSSGLLFMGLFLLYVALSAAAAGPAVAIAIFATIAVAFSYFAMIGRLAYAIGQAVNEPARVSERPPREDRDAGSAD
ncbi:MAG: hypothetical protein HKN47_14785 [Pirellulaceae bacterium]|nr:hypothetical protein [Pirellulaceae bacterium]